MSGRRPLNTVLRQAHGFIDEAVLHIETRIAQAADAHLNNQRRVHLKRGFELAGRFGQDEERRRKFIGLCQAQLREVVHARHFHKREIDGIVNMPERIQVAEANLDGSGAMKTR